MLVGTVCEPSHLSLHRKLFGVNNYNDNASDKLNIG